MHQPAKGQKSVWASVKVVNASDPRLMMPHFENVEFDDSQFFSTVARHHDTPSDGTADEHLSLGSYDARITAEVVPPKKNLAKAAGAAPTPKSTTGSKEGASSKGGKTVFKPAPRSQNTEERRSVAYFHDGVVEEVDVVPVEEEDAAFKERRSRVSTAAKLEMAGRKSVPYFRDGGVTEVEVVPVAVEDAGTIAEPSPDVIEKKNNSPVQK